MFNEKCEVLQNNQLASNVYEMVLKTDKLAKEAMPGQFIHIKINSGLYPLLRRPISINRTDKENDTVAIVYQVIGQGTEEMSTIQKGTILDIMGPLGKGFPIFEGRRCAVVGGGMGTAPLLELAHGLQQCDAYLGFRDEVYKLEEYQAACDKVAVATENGSLGHKGYVTELLEKNINSYDIVYTCGPKVMMKIVADICSKNNVECYVSLEERMACGIGACLVCACKVKGEDAEWHHKKACKDGPVFNAKEVSFDA